MHAACRRIGTCHHRDHRIGPRPGVRTYVHAGGGIYLLSQPEPAYGAEQAAPAGEDSAPESVAGSFASESAAGSLAGPGYEGNARSASADSLGEGATLASVLGGPTASIVSADVALDSADPVVGSFTVDGLTYALNDGKATLVAVSPDLQQVTDSQSADDSRVAPMLASGQVAIPASVDYGGISYDVTAIGPYAFYLSGVTDVALPASVSSVDSRAFRSSDVAWADVVEGNPAFASSDGALYSADLTRLLLIPGGRQGAVRIDSHAEEVPSSAFSHCAGITAISVDAGGAAFSSWDGLLYSADGSVLLRVPAGASDITVRDGCTAIASGAMEGCAKLERINAPATVTSISPDVFTSVPTVSLPAQSALQDEASSGVASSLLDQAKESADSAPQLTAMVALSSTDDDLPKVDPSSIEVALPEDANATVWQALGFSMRSAVLAGDDVPTEATAQAAASYAAGGTITGIDRVPGN